MHSQHLQARRVREGVGGQPPQPVARHHQVVQLAEPAQRLVAQGRDLVVRQLAGTRFKQFYVSTVSERSDAG